MALHECFNNLADKLTSGVSKFLQNLQFKKAKL
jgi:hypothetical protein